MRETVLSAINFSEGRREEVVKEITAAARQSPGVAVLDCASDRDHNRTVLTIAGSPAAMAEAAFLVTARAAELINMEEHQGGHPRMGAADVIPFVPVGGLAMSRCVELAREVGRRIGEELDIPVFLYEEAASSPERRSLAELRRGQYEGLKELLPRGERQPDYGPARMHPRAGAVAVGARPPLVAFNVNLDTDDPAVAKKIASAIREKDGGLRNVRAMGLFLADRGQAQVSMNLLDAAKTPFYRVVALIRDEADRYGARVTDTEVVGLCPREYLLQTAYHYLQLNAFEDDQVLEKKIARELGSNEG